MNTASATDRDLLRAHVDGDPHAFGELVRRHRDRLWAVALRTTADREEAADALQDAMIAAFRNAAGYRGDAAVTTWLHRIVVNASLDRLRRRRSRPAESLGDRDLPTHRDEHAATEVRVDVHAALADLPKPASTWSWWTWRDCRWQVAILLGGRGTVKSRCSRGAPLRSCVRTVPRSGNRTATRRPQEGLSTAPWETSPGTPPGAGR